MSRHQLILLGMMIGLVAWFVPALMLVPQAPREVPAWDQPVYADGRWQLSGIAEKLIRRKLFGMQVDLLRIRYGEGDVWTAAGAQRSDGMYESLIEGAPTREEVLTAFTFPRWVTLSVKGSPGSAGMGDCADNGPRCDITRFSESHVPILLDGDERYTESTSTIFVRTGVLSGDYLFGFLAWDIAPGQIIEPGMEGN